MKQRVLHILIALDQLAWVIVTLGNGYPDETISAALWRMGTVERPTQSEAREDPGLARFLPVPGSA